MNINIIKVEVKTLGKSIFNQLVTRSSKDFHEEIPDVKGWVKDGVAIHFLIENNGRLEKIREVELFETWRWVKRGAFQNHRDAQVKFEEFQNSLPQIFI